jgi:putative zinc finger/helix-turn-helix YgiT family protein
MYTKANIISKEETFNVKGENIVVDSSLLVCNRCNQDIFNEELDEKNLELAYSVYRKKHNLLMPSDIKEIREKYGLSQRSLGRLLEWGEITVNRYENGAIQDAPHNDILKFISNPDNMLEIYERNNSLLPLYVRKSLKKRINELMQEQAEPHFRSSLERYLLSNKVADEFSGYKEFDLSKMTNMILYITQFLKDVFKTKINKLLWYVDFLHFKEYSVSISGSNYFHLPYGPVPDNYDLIIGVMMYERLLEKEEITFEEGKIVGEKLIALAEYDSSCFRASELKVMDCVIEYFKEFSSGQISNKSHQEEPYKNTNENEKISYELSSELSLSLSEEIN